jgi:inhibitor of cysteine peptidase
MSLLAVLGLALAACQSGTPTPTPTGDGQDPITGQEATVESLQVMILESFPVQVHVLVSGYLPDGCVTLADISAEREGETFLLTLTTTRPGGDVACTEALVPFEETVPLDVTGLPAGEYTVLAGELAETFTLQMDNVLPDEDPAACPEPRVGYVRLEAVDREWGLGYCLLAPEGFFQEEGEDPHSWVLNGPNIPAAGGPEFLYGNLAVQIFPLEGASFEDFVEGQKAALAVPASAEPSEDELGQQTAVIVDAPVGDFRGRIIWAQYGDAVFQLVFSPLEPSLFPHVTEELEALYESALETWVFLDEG